MHGTGSGRWTARPGHRRARHRFSQPFFVAPNSDDGGENPGAGRPSLRGHHLDLDAAKPGSGRGHLQPTAPGGASANPVVFPQGLTTEPVTADLYAASTSS